MPQVDASRFSVGLTGGIGSGKSTVANLFAACGAAIVDTDLIAHQLTAPDGMAIAPIRTAFGEAFITTDGALDRAKMRETVFGDPSQKKRLESILHPLIRLETKQAAHDASGAYVIFVVPLLVESGNWAERVSRVLVVDCSEETQRQRVMQRSGLSDEQVRAIMATQASRTTRLAAAHDVILNEADPAQLPQAVERLHQQYLVLAAASGA